MDKIFDFLTGFITITGNSDVDKVLLGIIGLVSFLVAFGIVGKIFDLIGIYDADIMSGVHWTIRLIVFFILSYVCIKISQFINWLCSFQWWVYVIALVVFIILIIGIHFLKYFINKKRFKNKEIPSVNTNESISLKVEEPVVESAIVNQTSSVQSSTLKHDRDHCPRCGGKLVRRFGQYGYFYGCENYSKINCKYTRTFK